ncbi:beta/alpha barrel domain-containing protein [Komagataeibacter oboediens]|uniref:hypothetical protein n=1 Tax=Komagataeibacter oboediens TaxID=65958 RepID=UPI000237D85F|nr:hypothetical protein [Komagataeibacter oboediens]
MKTTEISPNDINAAIMALPPVARHGDGSFDLTENRRLNAWLRDGGVRSFMYGGVANLFNQPLSTYGALLDLIEDMAQPDEWVIPSIGADFGKAWDQVAILRERDFPTAILLPFAPVNGNGVATGLRRLTDRLGKPLMVFFKDPAYLCVTDAAALIRDGVLCTIEYGIAADDDGTHPYLAQLVDVLGSPERIIDGAGEKSIVATAGYGVRNYTSGSGVIAPRLSTQLHAAIRAGKMEEAERIASLFAPFEALRARISPIPVLHDGVRLAGIADTGVMGPFFASLTGREADEVRALAGSLLQHEQDALAVS